MLPDPGLVVPHQHPRYTAPKLLASRCHIPASRSPLWREGTSTAAMNPDQAATIVNTGSATITPGPTGTTWGGNHKSHCTISRARYCVRSAGSRGAYKPISLPAFAPEPTCRRPT